METMEGAQCRRVHKMPQHPQQDFQSSMDLLHRIIFSKYNEQMAKSTNGLLFPNVYNTKTPFCDHSAFTTLQEETQERALLVTSKFCISVINKVCCFHRPINFTHELEKREQRRTL